MASVEEIQEDRNLLVELINGRGEYPLPHLITKITMEDKIEKLNLPESTHKVRVGIHATKQKFAHVQKRWIDR